MRIPPLLIRLKLADHKHRVNLWIPLVLIWIIAGLLALALTPLILLIILLTWPAEWVKFLRHIDPRFYDLVCSLKGLEVYIRNDKQFQLYFK